ncbi:uncharacterized protein LOC122503950 isoform X1 [Leptopilina heterotoma]|uniref:uncharacterized protein LOC122503950 isoform X1 n=1 Tax=Leptopilina heterotoma TaxID=63436 RepID=UPI001CA932A7|nr:uncharacterized protein LOC122503950 isoform X1 [Leptopilina heterotoma]XP_043470668.1 uncharacterized protein LOC122503950 isoform X1 [Leptopilina heterotoma]XP_043470669.1 uncharacterized protein LOC122503950 isoform X1 [Leptopilina heterotoma]
MNENVYYDAANDEKIKYQRNFKTTLFNYIICNVLFKNYGNLYGFLAEIYRHYEGKQTIKMLLRNAKSKLKEIRDLNSSEDVALYDEVIDVISHRLFIPHFPIVRKDYYLDSVDFIYAQAGIIAGNEFNSTNNCPIKEVIRFQDAAKEMFLDLHLTDKETQNFLKSNGISLRTLALKSSMLTILKAKVSMKKINLHDMVNNIGYPKIPGVDDGYKLGDIFGADGLKSIEYLINTIEKSFFYFICSCF